MAPASQHITNPPSVSRPGPQQPGPAFAGEGLLAVTLVESVLTLALIAALALGISMNLLAEDRKPPSPVVEQGVLMSLQAE